MGKRIKKTADEVDVILIGAGIMSATLGTLINELHPRASIEIFERLDEVAAESSDAWNNAGTGHSALCELNYTPQRPDGSVDITKAIKIAESFEQSKEFWSYLVANGLVDRPESFIRSIPHMSFVFGKENVAFLKRRFETMKEHHLFQGMDYTEDHALLKEWIPLMMEGRTKKELLAATKIDIGTDVNFGALTRALFRHLMEKEGVKLRLAHEVRDIERAADGRWEVTVKNLTTDRKRTVTAKFVFIGAGGGSLLLLEKSGIPEAKGFGGFPVSGQWLKCTNPSVIAQHHAKVYGKAAVGSPPMSVPHLDTRVIDGKLALLFGPYAGFSTKFLKNGSWLDLPASIKLNNIRPMLAAGMDNIPLTKYLINQVRQSPEDRLEALREYVPTARMEDWELEIAGQRVQVIKKDEKHGGILEFGTEVVSSADGSIAALLGASPGASTSVSIMVDLLARCFPERAKTAQYLSKLQEMIPSFGQSIANNEQLCRETRERSTAILKLEPTLESV
ncbi:malate:quinone oxidoreductase [Parapedobacter indicus]|uniref:Probable malate:quinone oxidoreductase n=1 Tax=Parapedobacter indicus TaxID=1477437 RepID=A0A1I3DJ55_9SPHI|nr:malate:quinone oxidoreductase [Parapedobacter indicus]PPL04701.1 malate dehydrogenase (quinone) [Parapedobacter indicus]SFH86726.1 malate dehydrogenase (quinone) [Parapedobacter indicus]